MANSHAPVSSSYTSRQRFACVTFGVASTISVSTAVTLASVPLPVPQTAPHPMSPGMWQSHGPVTPMMHGLSLHSQLQQSPLQHSTVPHTATLQHVLNSVFHNHASKASAAVGSAAGARDLNLASASQTFVAGTLANFKDLTIQVGNVKEVVSLGTKLTAAEVVAAQQVLSTGNQTIKLGNNGTATGGTITLNNSLLTALDNSLGGQIGSLTISHGLRVVDTLSLLSISGSLNNYGSISTASGTSGGTDTIAAGTILNGRGATIGSYNGGSGSGSSSGLYAADPTLNALTSLTNNGSISSVGNLTINAPIVFNVAAHGAGSSAVPSISASQNVNINTQSLNNSGTIAALTGNVNVASNAALAVNNVGGTLQAKNGNINFNTDSADINVLGGSFLSHQVNLKAGNAEVELTANDVSGVVNASGNNVHLYSDSNLNLGNLDASGDPTIASAGNITVSGASETTNGNNLALVAGGNITSTGITKIDTTQSSGNGGNLILVAGANFTGNGTTTPVVITDTGNAGKGTSLGGLIDLTGGTVSAITTAGKGATGNAGSIQMIAYSGTGPNTGTITTPAGVRIDASSANGTYGDVTIYAGATPATTISTGGITGKNVTVGTFTPTVGSGVTIDITGTQTVGSFGTSGAAKAANVSIQADTFATGNVVMNAGGAITTTNIYGQGSGGTSASLNGSNGQNVTINAGNAISVLNIDVSGGGGAGGSGATNGGIGGNGGTINLTSTNWGITYGTINVSGGGGGGGAGSTELSAGTSGGAGGQAGSVTLSATTASNGSINSAGSILAYDGGAGGAGGNLVNQVGGGGGGGGSYGGAGGGGAGGSGTTGGDFGAGGGGGGSSTNFGGGGGAGLANSSTGTGGSGGGFGGGGAAGAGLTGTFSNGLAGVLGTGGAGGTGAASGGAGGTSPNIGGGGGGSTGIAPGSTGGGAQVVAGHGSITLAAGGIIGTSSVQTLTTATAALNVSSASNVFISDQNTNTLTLNATQTTALNQLVLNSAALAFNIDSAKYDTVTITNTNASASSVTLINSVNSPSSVIGAGGGIVSITSVGDIGSNVNGTGGIINGTRVFLTSTKGNIGSNGFVVSATAHDISNTSVTVMASLGSATLGTIINQGGGTAGVTITAGGAVTISNIFAQGAGGTASSPNGQTGQNVAVTSAGTITVTGVIDVSGGGGQGGAGASSGTNGGGGGSVTLTSSAGGITFGTINVSGGGGGGGAGSTEINKATGGGAGGQAGSVTLSAVDQTNGIIASTVFGILAYDGGAGGAGGGLIGTVGGGGGGGGSYGGAGGGGAGGSGNTNGDFGAGGGGGGSGSGINFGGGGGSGLANLSSGTAGNGGGYLGGGAGGTGAGGSDIAGNAGGSMIGGAGGGTGPTPGGAGGLSSASGAGGGNSTGGNPGFSGGAAQVVALKVGGITLTAGNSIGSIGTPLATAIGTLTINSGGAPAAASAYVTNTGGVALNVLMANAGTSGTLQIQTSGAGDGSINLLGAISGGTMIVNTGGASGNNIVVGNSISGGHLTLSAAGSGTITSSNPIFINTITSASFNTQGGLINIDNGNSLQVFNVGTCSTTGAGTITLSSPTQINIVGPVTTQNAAITISAVGSSTGINVGAQINAGSANVTLINSSTAGFLSESAPITISGLTTPNLILISATTTGTSGIPFVTNVSNTLTVNTTAAAAGAFISDKNSGTLNFSAIPTASPTGTVALTSGASTLNILSVNYPTVNITNNNPSSSSDTIFVSTKVAPYAGTAATVFTVVSNGNIDGALQGTSVSLTSNGGSIGPTTAVLVNSSTLALNAGKGLVQVTDPVAATITGGSALTSFTLIDQATSLDGIIIASKALVTGDSIVLTTSSTSNIVVTGNLGTAASTSVTLNSGANTATGITVGGAIDGATIALTTGSASSILVTGSVGSTTSTLVTVNSGANTGTGITVGGSIDAATINLTTSSTSSINVSSSLGDANTSLVSVVSGASSGSGITVGGSITGATINLTTSSTSSIDVTGTLGAAATATTVTLNSGATSSNGINLGTVINSANIVLKSTTGSAVSWTVAQGQSNTQSIVVDSGASLSPTIGLTALNVSVKAEGTLSISNSSITAINQLILDGTAILDVSTALTAPNIQLKTSVGGSVNLMVAQGSKSLNTQSIEIDNGINYTPTLALTATNVTLRTPGSLTILSGILNAANITLDTSAGGPGSSVTISKSIGITAGTTVITSADAITAGTGAVITGSTISLTAAGFIGTSAVLPLQTKAVTLSINSTGPSGWLQQTGNVNLGASSFANLLFLKTTGNTTITGVVSVGTVTLSSTGTTTINSGDSITAAGTISAKTVINNGTISSGLGLLTVTAGGTGNAILNNSGASITGTNVTLKTTSATGAVFNSLGATISAPTVTIAADLMTNNGALMTNALSVTPAGSAVLTFNASGTYQANMTSISILASAGTVTLPVTGTMPIADNISITAAKGLIVSGNTTFTANDGNNGGIITIKASAITDKTGSFTLNASAPGANNDGGNVNLLLTGTTALNIGTGAGTVNINVANTNNATGTKGGSVTVTDGANITADCNSINLGAVGSYVSGFGPSVSLTAIKGNLLVSNVNSINQAGLKSLTLASNSSTAFNLGGALAKKNGIIDPSINLTADSLTIKNTGGAITLGGGGPLSGTSSALIQSNGAIGLVGVGTAVAVTSPSLTVMTGKTGNAYINVTGSTSLGTGTAVGGLLQMTAPTGSVTNTGSISAGSVNLTTNGNLTLTSAKILAITASSTTGSISIADTQTALVTLNAISATTLGQTISITNGAAFKTAGTGISADGDITLTAGGVTGSITQGANISSTGPTGTVTLTAAGTKGVITDVAKGTYLTSGNTVSLNTSSTGIGTSTLAYRTSAPNLSISAGTAGAVVVTNTDTGFAGGVTVGDSSFGTLLLTNTNTSANGSTNTSSLNLNSLTGAGKGNITVSTNEQTLNLVTLKSITTTNGNITLQDTYLTGINGNPLINIADGTTIHAVATLASNKAAGNVFIALGTVPTSTTVQKGITPVAITPMGTTPNLLTFGTKSFPSGSITAVASDQLTSSARNLSFTTGPNLASQITLGNNVIITADPPAASGAISSSASLQSPRNNVLTTATASLAMAPLSNAVNAGSPNRSNQSSIMVANGGTVLSGLINTAPTSTTDFSAATSDSTIYSSARQNAAVMNDSVTKLGIGAKKTLTGKVSNAIHQTLDSGAIFMAPDQNTIVSTPFGAVSISAGAVALLVSFDKGLAVYDLHDNCKGAVVITADGHSTTLMPGGSAIVTPSSVNSFEEINPAQFVGYRRLGSCAVNLNTKIYQAEFEIMSMLQGIKPLSNLATSEQSQSPAKRKTMASMLKTAAILMDVTQGREPFRPFMPAQATACAAPAQQ